MSKFEILAQSELFDRTPRIVSKDNGAVAQIVRNNDVAVGLV